MLFPIISCDEFLLELIPVRDGELLPGGDGPHRPDLLPSHVAPTVLRDLVMAAWGHAGVVNPGHAPEHRHPRPGPGHRDHVGQGDPHQGVHVGMTVRETQVSRLADVGNTRIALTGKFNLIFPRERRPSRQEMLRRPVLQLYQRPLRHQELSSLNALEGDDTDTLARDGSYYDLLADHLSALPLSCQIVILRYPDIWYQTCLSELEDVVTKFS